jgi:hypothetical protein
MPGSAERWVAGKTAASSIWLQQANLKTPGTRECDCRNEIFPIMGMTVRIGTSLTTIELTAALALSTLFRACVHAAICTVVFA